MTEKRDFSSVDTRVPASSTPLFFLFSNLRPYLHPHRYQIYLLIYHRGACRMLSNGLTSHRYQQSSRDINQMTYIDIRCVYPCYSRDVHSCLRLPSTSLLEGHLLRSIGLARRRWKGGVMCRELMFSSGLSKAIYNKILLVTRSMRRMTYC